MTRLHLYRKRSRGQVYFRHPVTQELTRLPDDEASQAFEEAYGPLLRAVEGSNKPPIVKPVDTTAPKFVPGTIGFFATEYLGSPAFRKLAEGTARNYRTDLDLLRQHGIAAAQLHDLTPQAVDVYSGKIVTSHTASTADRHTTLLSNLWNFARTYECFKRADKHNPTIGRIRHHEGDEDGHLAWPVAVIDKFDAWAIADKPYLYHYRMGLQYTGQRGGDVVRMQWADYDRGAINVTQEKTGAKVWVPCPKRLRAMLDAMPRVSEYIFVNSQGNPYGDANTLSTALRLQLKACGFTGYSMHGLRKNAGVALAEAGCTPQHIMKILGHSSPKMALFYCEQANGKKLARAAIDLLDAAHEQEDAQRAEDKERNVAVRRRQIKAVGVNAPGTGRDHL